MRVVKERTWKARARGMAEDGNNNRKEATCDDLDIFTTPEKSKNVTRPKRKKVKNFVCSKSPTAQF